MRKVFEEGNTGSNGGINMTLAQEAYLLIQKQPEKNIKVIVEILKKLDSGLFSIEDINLNKVYIISSLAIREIGFLADDFISISSDFDTCLDGLEDYV